jgi:hypothetical protein
VFRQLQGDRRDDLITVTGLMTLKRQTAYLHPRRTPGLQQRSRFPRSQACQAGLSGAVSVSVVCVRTEKLLLTAPVSLMYQRAGMSAPYR